MTVQPRAGLSRVLEDLGTTLLDLVCGDPKRADAIGGVVIHDPLDEPALPRQALVLGVSVHGPADTARLLTSLGDAGAAALIVRSPAPEDPMVNEAAERSGVALLALTRGASWAQLAALLRSLLADGDVGEAGPQTLGGTPSGDMFALANAVAALLDAPVTIEDRNSRVLAFSGRQDEADDSRVETVLGRQVPERFTRLLEERGIFRDLYRTDQPVRVAPTQTDGFHIPRAAIAVRAGDEILGSIWAAVDTQLSPQRTRALQDAAKLVALHMLRLRAGADVERRLRADLLSTALEGGPGTSEALSRLGLTDYSGVVLALAVPDPPAPAGSTDLHARHAAERERLTDAFAMHLSAIHARAASALIGDVAYGILPVSQHQADAEETAARIASDFLTRVGDRMQPLIGVGTLARNRSELARSRDGADRALRVLRAGGGSRRLAHITDVHVEALLLDLADLAAERGDPPTGPLARLIAYDQRHHTNLVDTLRSWLNSFGDVPAAAEAMYVHQNTFRYRLRRVTEVAETDLGDPETRFALMLQLRLLRLTGTSGR